MVQDTTSQLRRHRGEIQRATGVHRLELLVVPDKTVVKIEVVEEDKERGIIRQFKM